MIINFIIRKSYKLFLLGIVFSISSCVVNFNKDELKTNKNFRYDIQNYVKLYNENKLTAHEFIFLTKGRIFIFQSDSILLKIKK